MIFDLRHYDYRLPEHLIAQNPVSPRDSSRLMILDARNKTIEHKIFRDIIGYISGEKNKNLLVLNDTRVIPARLTGECAGAKAEVLLLRPICDNEWQAIVKPGKRLRAGAKMSVGDGTIEITQELDDFVRAVKITPPEGRALDVWIDEVGETPLPPYIKNSTAPREAYQTVFARESGSSAAPTASLHFTNELLDEIKERGTEIAWVTLHVGLGTFRPVRTPNILDHVMHHETCTVPRETAKKIAECKRRGGKIIAGGTTVVRTLESFRLGESGTRETDLFITPGFDFKIADHVITNFHTPKSSLLMLAAAFAGSHKFLMTAYRKAIAQEYRFFSFGDAMLIMNGGRA